MVKTLAKIYAGEWEYLKAKVAKPVAICVIAFFVILFLYYVVAAQNMEVAKDVYEQISQIFEEKGFLDQRSNLGLFWMIFTNNSMAGFFMLVTGILPFIFAPLWAVVSNAALAGVVIAVALDSGSEPGNVLLSILPHGIFELPAFFVAAGLGLRISHVATKKIIGRGAGLSFWGEFWRAWQSFVAVALPLFLAAALVEAFVTIMIVK